MKTFLTHRVLVGVVLLPMLLGALVVWSLSDRAEKVQQVPAAVVNLDRPVVKKGQQPVAAGRVLAAALTSPTGRRDPALDWELTDPAHAQAGLRDGDYYAVLTIPHDFSRTIAASLHGRNPRRASIEVASDASSSALAGAIGDQVARVSAKRLGTRVTTTYLDQVFSKTGKLAGSLGKAAAGADRLAQGTTALGDGTSRLADGLSRLAGGAGRLASGADELSGGTNRLAHGAHRLAGGAHRLAGGLGTLSRRTDPLPHQTDRLADGARGLSRGVVPYTKLLRGWAQACANPVVAASATRLCVATERAVGPGGSNAKKLARGSRRLADGTRRLADAMPPLVHGIDRLAGGGRRLADGTARLASGTDRLATGSQRLSGGAAKLAEGAGRASDGASQLAAGTDRLGSGSSRLADGLDQGAQAIPTYDAKQRRDLADVIAAPVAAAMDRVGDRPDGATLLAPGAIAFALWLGAFVVALVRPPLPERLLRRALPAVAVARGGLVPALALGALQAVLLYVALVALGADLGAPWAALPLMLLASASFAALHQAFGALLGRRRGWLLSIAVATLQVVSLGGIIPLATAPEPLRALNGVLPMTVTADALVAALLDGPGSVVAAVVVLVVWGLVAFGASVLAARRAQTLDLDDLRPAAGAEEREPEPVA